MLSGNGRHRRPRQAPALIVAAGVTGSAIAIPLLGASGASAADGTAWDRVAECETGGAWSENSGNGYYGGLQLSQEDWEKYGGLEYAASADQASRSQQISVAEKILADQGVGAWPTCGLLSGLSKDSGSVDVDTGVGDEGSSGKSDSSDSPGLLDSLTSPDSSSSSSSSSPSASPDKSSDTKGEAGKSGTSSDSGPDPTATDRTDSAHPGDPAGSGESGGSSSPSNGDDSDKYGQYVGVSSLVDTGAIGTGRHRGDSAKEAAADSDAAASSGRHAARGDDAYTVRPGDTLASIADSLDLQGGWRELYARNKKAIGDDPARIVPGETLAVGAESGEK
ncbi:transglycosylase family protein [Streptomyces sp. S.PNR 29]|uniref:LysM peptidoglycan-binding domain-containing protein n=1 Tax=Streptomyces sp. S.PNR 29 TaxID=2973805 RepID=UPI0025B0EF75|nr:transglycosylase family protein [Streptomyces sp. S.PNR 29]MDN0200883.1 LysM peptidoglycan-binding domain-containing protein [Streptomyces sp. S.PNR 29]